MNLNTMLSHIFGMTITFFKLRNELQVLCNQIKKDVMK